MRGLLLDAPLLKASMGSLAVYVDWRHQGLQQDSASP